MHKHLCISLKLMCGLKAHTSVLRKYTNVSFNDAMLSVALQMSYSAGRKEKKTSETVL